MFGFLKNLMGGKSEPAKPASPPPPPAKPAAPAETKSAPAEPAKPAKGAAKSNAPAPAPAVAPAAAPAPAAPPAPSVPVENVTITLAGIVKKLPQELQDKVKAKPGPSDMVTLGIKKLAEQLQQGSVKITLGELQKVCPPNTFGGVDGKDQTMVELPLAEILSKISPNLLTRRANQKKVEIPSDVVGLFSNSGGAISSPSAPAAPAAAPAPEAKPAAAAPAPAPTPAAAPAAAPKPEPPPPAPTPAPAPKPEPEAAAPIQISSSLRDAMTAASASAPAAPPLKPTGTGPAAPASAKLPVSAAPAPVASAPSAAPASGGDVVTVAVSAVSANWPDAIKQEAAKAGPDAKIDLPAKNVGDNLRMGKLSFPWKLLRTWVKPAALTAASSQDETLVDLPLAVVAPIFMAMKPVMRTQKKVSIDDKIPDMFAGRSAAPPEPAAPAPVAPEPPAAATAPAAAAPATPQPSGWTAKEMVQKASALPGMSGAVIALQDGLVVESQLPAPLKGETVAGFLPQIFNRINQYTNEMSLGELNGLTLVVNNAPCQIYKAGGVYFAALGRAGEPLPTVQLNVIAAELGRQNNK